MNETLKTIAERYSCRDFNGVMPSDEDLRAITQAAIQAPSGTNRQHWHVIVVKNQQLLSQMEAEGLKMLAAMEDQSYYQRIMSRGGKLFYHAPCMILIAVKEAYPKGAELIDLGIVAQNVSLAATSLGIANVHCGLVGLAFAGDKACEFKTKLKFPEGYECGLGVLLGYANTVTPPHQPNQEKITWIE
ncbi:MAG: nitroreductase family protein [Oscillospiraceae bacterium]|jgi:nitroreductase